jgi:hypothetical protein
MTADLDKAFRYELAEIIERGLSVYRPILSHLVTATFRHNLVMALDGIGDANLRPLLGLLAPGRLSRLHGTDTLTAGQVALLGGTRPTRILHSVVFELGVLLDGGDKPSVKSAKWILMPTSAAVRSFVAHHVVAPVKGQGAAARKLSGIVDLGIAAQIASTMGALHDHRMRPEDASGDDEIVRRYFLGMVQTFGRIRLARSDQKVFRDQYIDGVDVKDLVEDEGRDLDEEVELRHGFLKRLATALKAQIKLVTARPAPEAPRAELPATRSLKRLPGRD